MRILVLSFYFRPDLCAGSFRISPLIAEIQNQLQPGDSVDVVTTMPNRYSSYEVDAPHFEETGPISITRIRIPKHESGMVDQARAFISFAWSAWKVVKNAQPYDVVVASSSRLFTAFLGALVARREGAFYYADIRDIFTDTLGDILPQRSPLRMFLPAFRRLEAFTINQAAAVNLVSEGFREYFRRFDESSKYRFFTNGIDNEFLDSDFSQVRDDRLRKRVLYAGNIGTGQSLDMVLPRLAKLAGNEYEFVVIGDGGTRKALEAQIKNAELSNVRLLFPVSRNELIQHYAEADILFLHLNDHPAMHKVLPSKIFEYAATGKPLLAGVSGYAATFLDQNVENSAVFRPLDADGGLHALKSLKHTWLPRSEFKERFQRQRIMHAMAADILSSARASN